MFSSGPSYPKLKTNLRLSINRLKLLEKKKTELTQKARKEIADYISAGKTERAKIRVEHIIREDYLVEAMEVTEMYCDLVLARFGLIQQMKDLDPGLSEAISSLIWAGPRLMSDIPELKTVGDQFALKYGKPYAQACREQSVSTISEKLIHKMNVQAPPKMLVERYLQEIASNYNLEYTPDPQMLREELNAMDPLISLDGPGGSNNLNDGGDSSSGGAFGGGSGGGGGMNIPQYEYPSKAAEAGALNFPDIPGQPSYPQPTPFNYQNIQPPPADMSADKPSNSCGGVGSSSNWDEMLNLDCSPPPPYTSLDPNCVIKDNSNASPSAPPPSMPPVAAPRNISFPPDVNTGGDASKPDPAPKFDANDLGGGALGFNLPDLPNVPSSASGSKPNNTSPDDIDFDDLNARFQQLKKK